MTDGQLQYFSQKVGHDIREDAYVAKSSLDKQVGGEHYKDKPLQPWEIIEKLGLSFFEGNALKYLLRYKEKNGVEDLKKAIHYIEYIIEKENNNG